MKFFNALRLKAAEFITGRKSTDAWWQSWLQGNEGEAGKNGAILTNAFQQSEIVYSCVQVLADNVASVPFEFYTGEGKQKDIVDGGPVVELFSNPHPYIDGVSFKELITQWLHLRGEAPVVGTDANGDIVQFHRALTRNTGRKITRLHVLPPTRFREIITADRMGNWELRKWMYSASSYDSQLGYHDFLPEEVQMIKFSNPYWFWRGMSPLQAADVAASGDYAAAVFSKGLMMDNAEQGLIVTTGTEDMDDKQREQILASIRNRRRMSNSKDRYTIISGKDVRIEKPALSAVDNQMLESRKHSRQQICAVFRVPEQILGFNDNANRAIAQTVRLDFTENRIANLCQRIACGLQPIVSAMDPLLKIRFNLRNLPIMQEALKLKADTATKLWQMGFNRNEINDKLDMGFLSSDTGEDRYVPVNMLEEGMQPVEPAADPAKQMRRVKVVEIDTTPDNPFKYLADHLRKNANAPVRVNGKVGKLAFEKRNEILSILDAEGAPDSTKERTKEFFATHFKS